MVVYLRVEKSQGSKYTHIHTRIICMKANAWNLENGTQNMSFPL